jgi:hypothetical protein
MRLWAEERNSGSIELLMTLPITLWQAVAGKFLAAWCFAGIALALTFPVWITINYLGSPDNGAIIAAYIGSFLMAGGFLAIGMCLSAATRNQVIAFITAALVGFIFCSPASRWCSTSSAPCPQVLVDAHRVLEFFHALRGHFQGRHRPARSGVFRSVDRLLADGHCPGARHEEGGIGERKSLAKTGYGIGGLIALAVLFLGVVMLSNAGLRGMRLDLTQNKLYTLSPGTSRCSASSRSRSICISISRAMRPPSNRR